MTASREPELHEKECAFLEGVRRRCPDFIPVLEALGDLYTKHGKIEEGLEVDLRLTTLFPENPTYQYNLGCSFALMNRQQEALDVLAIAIKHGYSDVEWMLKDADLKSLRKTPEFAALISQIKRHPDPA